ncbi:uncharacterized protein LOC128547425 [Mercenaria mercenaria]|uniref:uncharacterized protein LOC128547425 n=1 Tax=Mercenaria mercenaria TaxID=6596 RepID=UPI00234E8F07|nr:uncharacterized protein LOC128547425 [Mercenaria mercenaria]
MATASSIVPTEGKASCLRLLALTFDGGTMVLRHVFDQNIAPSDLQNTLNDPNIRQKLNDLIKRGIITTKQRDVLFPQTGQASSEEFDVTLLTCLLRYISGLDEQSQWWGNRIPPSFETSTEADINRLKRLRNELCHLTSLCLKKEDFENKWTETEQVLLRLGTGIPHLSENIQRLKEDNIDPEREKLYEDKMKEVKEMNSMLHEDMTEMQTSIKDINEELTEVKETVNKRSDEITDIMRRQDVRNSLSTFESTLKQAVQDLQQQKNQHLDIRHILNTIGTDVGENTKMSSELESLVSMSKLHLEDFSQDNEYIVTTIHETARQMLDASGCLVLSGFPGEGKTYMASKLISETVQPDRCLKLRDWSDWKHVDLSKNLFDTIFIDDMFGAGILDDKLLKGWSLVIPDIEKALQKKKVKVIITSRHYILEEAKETLSHFSLFKKENMVVLSSCYLTEAEKTKMLEAHLRNTSKHFDIRLIKKCIISYNVTFEQLQIRYRENVENMSSLQELDKKIPFFELERIPVMIGFPETASLFSRNDQLFQQNSDFFRKPVTFFKSCMEDLFRKRKHFLALILIWARPEHALKKTDLEPPDISDEIERTAEYFDFKLKGKTKAILRKSLKYHEGGFLRFNPKTGVYTFCHNIVRDMVGVVASQEYPHAALEFASEEFVMQYVTTDQMQNDGLHVFIEEFRFTQLRQTMCKLLAKEAVALFDFSSFSFVKDPDDGDESRLFRNKKMNASVVKHDCFKNDTFVETFVSSQEGKDILSRTVVTFDGQFGQYGIHFGDKQIHITLPSYALCYKNSTILKKFLTHLFESAVPDKKEFLNITMLIAVHQGMSDVVQLLLKYGIAVNEDAIYIAAVNQHIDLLSFLLENRAENYEKHSNIINRNSPLMAVAKRGFIPSVKCLVDHGVEVNYRNIKDVSALEKAIIYNQTEVCELLINNGANINIRSTKFKRTPLHIAADIGVRAITELLLQHGAQCHVKDYRGHYPIHCAAIRSKNETVDILLKTEDKYQSSLWLKSFGTRSTIKGMDLFHIAVWKNNTGLIDILLNHHRNPNVTDFYGRTPLYRAAFDGKIEIVDKLIDVSNVLKAEKNGYTPLHAAIHRGHTDIAKLLCSFADINVQDKYGKTPLHTACEQVDLTMFRTLLEDFNADVRMLTNKGLTVFDILKKIDTSIGLSIWPMFFRKNANSDHKEDDECVEQLGIDAFKNIILQKDPEFVSYCFQTTEQDNNIPCETSSTSNSSPSTEMPLSS